MARIALHGGLRSLVAAIASLMALPARAQDCHPYAGPTDCTMHSWSCVDIQWDPNGRMRPGFGCSITSAVAGSSTYFYSPGYPPASFSSFYSDPNAFCSSAGYNASSAHSSAYCGELCNPGQGDSTGALAETLEPSHENVEAKTEVCRQVMDPPPLPPDPNFPPDGSFCNWTHFSSGFAVAQFRVVYDKPNGPTSGWTLTYTGVVTGSFPPTDVRRFVRTVHLATNEPERAVWLSALEAVGTYRAIHNLTYAPSSGEYSTEVELGGNGATIDFRSYNLTYDDRQFDMDGSDRFNELDVSALGAYYGSSDPNALARWDVSGDGQISAADAELMATLVSGGLASGILGDANGDSVLTCADLVDLGAHVGYHLGESSYRVALDFDLNGIVEASDLPWVYRAVMPGDVTGDGAVGQDDLDAVLFFYGPCRSGGADFDPFYDLNGDGCIDQDDLDYILFCFGTYC